MTLPSVAVIIPCYNAEKWVAQAIQSALDQDYPNLEVIVIDDGSMDGSLDVIKSFGGRIRWETGPNRGACAARNRGLALTEAEYVKFLDADDWLVPGSVAGQVSEALRLDPAARCIVFGDAIATDADGNHGGHSPNPWLTDGELASKVWLLLDGPRTTAPLHRREYLLEAGGFREDRPAGQEYDLHVRLYRLGVSFLYRCVPIFYYRQHASVGRISTAVKRNYRYWSNINEIYESLIENKCELSAKDRLMMAKYAWERGRFYLRQGIPESRELFALARRIESDDFLVGGRAYRIIYKFVGARLAELFEPSVIWTVKLARAVRNYGAELFREISCR